MEIKLDDQLTFEIEYKLEKKKAKFIFNHNSRSLYILATEGFSREALAKRAKIDLVKIEGLTTGERDVTPDDFEALPIDLYAFVLSEYDKKLAEKIKVIDSEKKP